MSPVNFLYILGTTHGIKFLLYSRVIVNNTSHFLREILLQKAHMILNLIIECNFESCLS
jgi:hypothetical protein